METIIKYKAFDGTEFADESKCLAYEDRGERIHKALSGLVKQPEGTSFCNGSGYLQHSKESFISTKIALLEIAKEETGHKWIQESIDNDEIHSSYAGRIISDGCSSALNKAWYRIQCVDKEFREWGQPYYASHPNEGTQACLNP